MIEPVATALPRQRWQNLIAAISCVTVFGFALGQMFPLLSLIMEREGVAPDIIGFNTSMQPVGILLSGLVVPPLVHRFGAKTVVICAACAASAIVVCYPLLPIYWAWFGLRFLQGLAVSTLFSISEAWVVRFAEGPYRARIVGIYASVLALSFGLGSYAVAILGIDGMMPFAVGAGVLILATLPVLFLRDEAMPDSDEGGATRFLTFVPKAPVLLLAVGVFAIFDAACLGFLPVYGVKVGMSQEDAAMTLAVMAFGNVGFQFLVGWLADKLAKRAVMTWLAVLTGALTALIPMSVGTPWLWVLLLVIGATSVGIYTVALAELGERFTGSELVAGTSAMSTTWGTGALLGSLIAGYAMNSFGPNGFPYAMAIVFALFIIAIGAREHAKRRKQGLAA
ncbi:MAG: MFS transporter [Hyphomicrobiaceae bacterium]